MSSNLAESAEPADLRVAPIVEDRDVLAAARGFADQITDAELGLMCAGLEWVHRNPGTFMAKNSDRWWDSAMADLSDWEDLADEGMPLVDDMSIPEFAYAAGMSDRVARSLIHDAVVLFYRFPRTWARMTTGHIPCWRARLVARNGRGLGVKAAEYVDRNLDMPGARFTKPQIQRLVDEARMRYSPDEVAREAEENAEARAVEIDTRSGAHLGLADLTACLELRDALDLEAALAYGAARLKQLGSTDPLNVRRAQALGDLARGAQVPDRSATDGDRVEWDGTGVSKPRMKFYVHFNHTAFRCACTGSPPDQPGECASGDPGSPLEAAHQQGRPPRERRDDQLGEVARVEATGAPTAVLPPEVIRRWFARTTQDPGAIPKLVVRPVLDPEEYVGVESYEIPERIREAVRLRDRSCVFPFCNALAEHADCDHTTPFTANGPTCTCNLAALCRTHHRVKTHGQKHEDHKWTYASVGDGKYLWCGPNQIRLLRTPLGTRILAEDIFAVRPTGDRLTPGVRLSDGTYTAFTEEHPAFDTVTHPMMLPRFAEAGVPEPNSDIALVQDALLQRGRNPHSDDYYVRYAARGDDLARPEIQICPDGGQIALPDPDEPASSSVQFINVEVAVEKLFPDYPVDATFDDTPFNDVGPPPF